MSKKDEPKQSEQEFNEERPALATLLEEQRQLDEEIRKSRQG